MEDTAASSGPFIVRRVVTFLLGRESVRVVRSAGPSVARLVVPQKRLEPSSAAPIATPAQENRSRTTMSPSRPSRLVGGGLGETS